MAGKIVEVSVGKNDYTSYIEERRDCGCVIRWGPFHYFQILRCDACLAWEHEDRRTRPWYKPWTW